MNLADSTPPARNIADPFTRALAEVAQMAEHGKKPAECAVVYRSLARQYPQHQDWLYRTAAFWSGLRDNWT